MSERQRNAPARDLVPPPPRGLKYESLIDNRIETRTEQMNLAELLAWAALNVDPADIPPAIGGAAWAVWDFLMAAA
nr:MAG TPA: hypothetical protein [Caudoviricetes sp.]